MFRAAEHDFEKYMIAYNQCIFMGKLLIAQGSE